MHQTSTEGAEDGLGKKIHWELCKRVKFCHTIKLYIYRTESFQEYEMHIIIWDFETQLDHLISTRRLDLVLYNKPQENFLSTGFCSSGAQQREKKRKWKNNHIFLTLLEK